MQKKMDISNFERMSRANERMPWKGVVTFQSLLTLRKSTKIFNFNEPLSKFYDNSFHKFIRGALVRRKNNIKMNNTLCPLHSFLRQHY